MDGRERLSEAVNFPCQADRSCDKLKTDRQMPWMYICGCRSCFIWVPQISARVDPHMIIYGRARYRAYEKLFSKMKNLSGW